MLKKRLIFTLLFDQGFFMLSRNFRLQKVGDLRWLENNYDFFHIAFSIDELIVLDVSRKNRDMSVFCEHLKSLTKRCFIPISAGGGVTTVDHARTLLRSGADKVVINTSVFQTPELVGEIASEFGQQCVVASVDAKQAGEDEYQIWSHDSNHLKPYRNGGRNSSTITWIIRRQWGI